MSLGSALLLGAGVACDEPHDSNAGPRAVAVTPPPAATAPAAPVPWFSGTWLGGGAASDTPEGPPIEATIVIDDTGRVTGSTSLDLAFRGAVDEDTVRVEGDGPGGHGVLVLHRARDTLLGTLHYSAPGAEMGKQARLSLSRTPRP